MTAESTDDDPERGDDEREVSGDVDDSEESFSFEEPLEESPQEPTDDDTPADDPEDIPTAPTDSLPIPEERRSAGGDLTATEQKGESVDDEQRRKEPLGDLTDRIRNREPDEEFSGLFDREDIDGIDHEKLWEQVEGTDDPLEDPTTEPEIREIPKGKYCHQCEHFSDPPEVGCHHEGTTILELVDLETFRVIDCPVVLKNELFEE